MVDYDSDNMSEGGGLYQGPIRVVSPHFGYSDYNGNSPQESVAFLIEFEHPNPEGGLKTSSQIMSVGKGFVPSEDGETPSREGKHLIPEEAGRKFNKNTAFGIWLASLQKVRGKKLDAAKGAEDMEDLKLEIGRDVFPTPQKKDRQCYFATALLTTLPWERGNGNKKSKPVAEEEEEKPIKKVIAKPVDEDATPTVSKKTLNKVMAAMVKASGKKGFTVGELPKLMYKVIGSDFEELADERQAYAEAASEDSYLEKDNENFSYDSDTGKITPA